MMIKAERNRPEYIFDATISNLDQRIWLIHRLGSLDWKKRYRNRHNNTECPFFNCSQDDTFDHSLVCLENPVKKPRQARSDRVPEGPPQGQTGTHRGGTDQFMTIFPFNIPFTI